MEEFDIDRLKDYISNKLSKEEKESVEIRLARDPEYKEQFEIHKSLLDGIDFHFDKQLKQSLKDHESRLKKRRLSMMMAIAASVLAGAFFIYMISDVKVDHAKVFLNYYKPYYNVVDEPRRDSVRLPDDASAFQLYDKMEYARAINGFRNELMRQPNSLEASFYLGLSYLAVDKPDSAVAFLNKSYQGSDLSEPAEWYLGLAYLKSGKTDRAKDVFRQIAGKTGGYRNRAQSILDDL